VTVSASTKQAVASVQARQLRVGDRVRVRSREEILKTLDGESRIDGLPFMPEMLAFAGQELPVDAVVHRTCDTIKTSGTSGTTRGMEGVVHLTGVRCDGSAHGGCQARCLIYWKEDWLEPVGSSSGEASPSTDDDVPPSLLDATHGPGHSDSDPVYSCQATEVLRASCFVSPYAPRVWVADLKARNASPWRALIDLVVVAFNKWQTLSKRLPRQLRLHDGESWPWYGASGERRREAPLDLQPGETVEIKSKEEIEATLDTKNCVRGLRFGREMLPYCGKQARVLDRVDRIVDEKTGRMLSLRDCFILEGVWCEGTYRLLCRRKIYAYWREAWLRRIDGGK
jgi:hypothetical protein